MEYRRGDAAPCGLLDWNAAGRGQGGQLLLDCDNGGGDALWNIGGGMLLYVGC